MRTASVTKRTSAHPRTRMTRDTRRLSRREYSHASGVAASIGLKKVSYERSDNSPCCPLTNPQGTRWWWSPRRYQLTLPAELPAEAPPELRRPLVRTRVLCGSALHIRGKGWAAESTFSGVNSARKRPLSWDPAFLCHSGDQQGARRQAGSVPCAWWHRPPP